MTVNMKEKVEETKGYEGQLFVGTVTDAVDPTGQGRFQVRIPGLLEEGELPWIGFIRHSNFGIGPSWGSYGRPWPGSQAIIEFQNGDVNFGVCIGFLVKGNEAPAPFANPNTWGYMDPLGNYASTELDTGLQTVHHASGTRHTIDNQGNTVATVAGNLTANVQGDVMLRAPNINVRGNFHHAGGSFVIDDDLDLIKHRHIADGPTSPPIR